MKHTIPVAIYIPTYNRAATLRRAIESALSQTYSNITVYCSDNASTDHTADVCRQYEHNSRFVYHRQPNNSGALSNFTWLYNCSDEPWLLYLADDDYLSADYVEKCLEYATRKDCIVVGGVAVNMADGKVIGRDRSFEILDEDPLLRLFRYQSVLSTNALFYGVRRRNRLLLDGHMPGADWLDTYYQLLCGKAAVIRSASICRDFSKWQDCGKSGWMESHKSRLDAFDYTGEMLEQYDGGFAVLEELCANHCALVEAGIKRELPLFLNLVYLRSCRKCSSLGVAKDLNICEFVSYMITVAEASGYCHMSRYQDVAQTILEHVKDEMKLRMQFPDSERHGTFLPQCCWSSRRRWQFLIGISSRMYCAKPSMLSANANSTGRLLDRHLRLNERESRWRNSKWLNIYWYGRLLRKVPGLGVLYCRWRQWTGEKRLRDNV